MPVFRVTHTEKFTVMSNYHLQDVNLSLKAKGLLSMMLSFSDKWNYTIRGLATICKEGVEAIRTGLKELEKIGYLIRRKLRDESGRIIDTEYTIYEWPMHRINDNSAHTGDTRDTVCKQPIHNSSDNSAHIDGAGYPICEQPMHDSRDDSDDIDDARDTTCEQPIHDSRDNSAHIDGAGYSICEQPMHDSRDDSDDIDDAEDALREQTMYDRDDDSGYIEVSDYIPDDNYPSAQYDTDEQSFSEQDTDTQDMYTAGFYVPETSLPYTENPNMVTPYTEEKTQINTNGINTKQTNTEKPSFPFASKKVFSNETATMEETKRKAISRAEIDLYRHLICTNIRYADLLREMPDDERLEQLVELMTEVVCSNRPTIRVAGSEFPQEDVKARFLKLNDEHIRYVIECLDNNTTKIRNMKQYLITTLFNAYTTITQYYFSEVRYDTAIEYGYRPAASK